jgi:hypothetical protein
VTAKHPLPSPIPSGSRESALANRVAADWRGYGKPHVYETNGCGKIRIGFVLGSFFAKYNVFNLLHEFGAISFLLFLALALLTKSVHFANTPTYWFGNGSMKGILCFGPTAQQYVSEFTKRPTEP